MVSDDSQPLEQRLLSQAIQQLSGLDSKIGVLQGQMAAVVTSIARAEELRNAMSDRLHKLDHIENTLDRIVPLVDKHEERHNKTEGAMHLGKGLWTLLAGSGVGAAVTTIIQFFVGNHPGHAP